MADLYSSNWSETDASNSSAAPDGAPEGMPPAGLNNTMRAMMGAVKRLLNQIIPATTGGTSTAYTLTYAVAPGALVNGMTHLVQFNATSGASPTLNVNSLGAKPIYQYTGGAWAQITTAGLITANSVHRLAYNSSDGAYRITSSTSPIGAAFLAVANAFTGNNTFAGTSGFTGDVTMTAGTNAIKAATFSLADAGFGPQGQLTLATGVPVMVSAQTGKETIYYTPHVGNLVPVYDGTDFVWTPFSELSNDTTESSTGNAGPAAVTTDSNYDLFVWNDAGTIRLTRGPAWTNDTTRSAGTALVRVNGVLLNNASITNGPAASRGTYVGTVRSDGSSQINWQPGGTASGGTAAILGVWNAYNRVAVEGIVKDSTASWSYGVQTYRAANGSNGMRVSFVIGLQEDAFYGDYMGAGDFTGGVAPAAAAIGYDSTSVASGRTPLSTAANVAGSALTFNARGDYTTQPLGFHFMQALEWGGSKWYGSGGLFYRGRF